MSSETDHLSHFYESERNLVEKIINIILECNKLRDTVKARYLSLQASEAQILQLEEEKTVLEKSAKKLAKYEERPKDSGLEGVEEVINGMEFMKNALDAHRDGADGAEKALKITLGSQRNRVDAAERESSRDCATHSIAVIDQLM
ncbi:hypothetical protein sscle_04g039970 [Sclerotinia sclerotiorum 1980 UF-70]|nr:hypothetical protein sscle_04g039970 [Sclerotinia sclerotiorum 1980 UF-70]